MTRIKICGLSREEDIDSVNAALPDYIGFVFALGRRQITATKAADLRAKLDKRIIPVGVFVNQCAREVAELYLDKVIDMAQLHGTEDPEYIQRLRSYCDVPVIKTITIDDQIGLPKKLPTEPDFLLFDYKRPGSGISFDWNVLKQVSQPAQTKQLGLSYFLAGGINSQNISEALSYQPFCIDISSGAETDGLKDATKINALTQLTHNYQKR